MSIGSVIKNGEGLEAAIRGRDMITVFPREVIVTDSDIREAIIKISQSGYFRHKEVIEETPRNWCRT